MAAIPVLKIVAGKLTQSTTSDAIEQVENVSASQTTGFTAGAGSNSYPIDTSGGAFAVTLPTAPTLGTRVGFKDIKKFFQVNALTINAGGSDTIEQPTAQASAASLVVNTANFGSDAEGIFLILTYFPGSLWVIT